MSGLKKNLISLSVDQKRSLINCDDWKISVRRQCELIELNRSSLYYAPVQVSVETLRIMNRIDEIYMAYPFYGKRRIATVLQREGILIGFEKAATLMKKMGLAALYPKRNLSKRNQAHKIYPYLLRGLPIVYANHVWSADITYIRMRGGFMYLIAVIDWFSRYVLGWALSNTLATDFCLEALEMAFVYGQPDIFNTDQGCQFTSEEFTGMLIAREIKISMDGRGRALDNVFIERLWRSLKYERVYLNDYGTVAELKTGVREYFEFYNNVRPHQSLGYLSPVEVYKKSR